MLSDNLSAEAKKLNGNFQNGSIERASKVEYFMNLHRELDRLEEMLLESGPRIMGHTVIDEEKVCGQIDRVRLAVPESITKAEEILQYKQDIIAEAEQYAEDLLGRAEAQAARMVEESLILRQAETEADRLRRATQEDCQALRDETLNEVDRIRRQAQKELEGLRHKVVVEAEDMQRGADEYSDRTLGTLEVQLIEMLKVVQNGRKELRR